MANSNDKNRLNYGASNYKPDSGRGSVSFGRVGDSVRDLSGRSYGSGVGATVSIPMKSKSKAKGGAIKKSGCEVKAYGDMIRAVGKKANGGKVQTSSDTARKLATEMGGMKKGGVQKKAVGGAMYSSRPQPTQPTVAKPKMPMDAKTIADMVAEKNAKPTLDRPMVNPGRPKTVRNPFSTDPVRPMPTPKPRVIVDPMPKPPVRPVRPTPMPKPPVVVKPTPKPSGGTFMPWDNKPPAEAAAIQRKFQDAERTMTPAEYKRFAEKYSRPATGPDPRMMAKGGAGKVRKGMMSPQGSILKAVKPKKGLGGM